ncbi:MAG TPA: IS1182 family transposase, partial [candidate division Zixibacteria bacterium]|nr:IS1182 family transposase [candidate division Zixibacteria bacterium]
MQTKRDLPQPALRLMPPIETMIPQEYYLRRLNKVIDLNFVHEAVRDKYCQDNGRPSIDPEVVIRLFLLQAIEGIGSVRELMQRVQVDLSFRWFIGYEIDESLPDHSTLSRALDRFGDAVFNELFARSIAQCQASGLVSGKVVHVDATTIRADIDKNRVNRPDSSDGDARYGRFPDGSKQPGYKQQTVVDDESRVVLAVEVMPANRGEGSDIGGIVDEASGHLDNPPEVLCADSAYANGPNAQACVDRGIRLVSPPSPPLTHHTKDKFSIEQFTYDAERDVFICPAGKELVQAGRMTGRRGRYKYRARQSDCRVCPLKDRCTSGAMRCLNAGEHHAALVHLRADSQRADFKALYRRRAPVIEGVFAEAKQWHGLRRAWRRGLAKMRIQCLLIATVLNFKRQLTPYRLAGALHLAFLFLITLLKRLIDALTGLWSIP